MRSAVRMFVAAGALALAGIASAQSKSAIGDAKQAGIVGERYDGYLGISGAANERVRRQVGEVNIRRRSLYTGLASRRNATVQEVGIAAGCELLPTVGVGEIYMLSDGAWRKRMAGQAVPLPGYCGR